VSEVIVEKKVLEVIVSTPGPQGPSGVAGPQPYLLLTDPRGAIWKLELVGATDEETEPKWTKQ